MSSSKTVQDQDGWETKECRQEFADDHLEVVTETVKTPSQEKPKRWTIVRRKPAVVIAGMTRDERILLVREERVPTRQAIWEIPAGQIDEKPPLTQSQIEETALRELQEETGYELAQDGELIALGDFYSSPGFTDEHEYMFLARPVELSNKEQDKAEPIVEKRAFTVKELQQMIADNVIRDSNTLSIYARMIARGLIAPKPCS